MEQVTWVCDGCGETVPDGEGYVYCLPPVVARNAGEHHYAVDRHGRSRWLVHHRECEPDPWAQGYRIDVERIRSYRHLAAWTVHLLDKPWVQDETDWDVLVGRVAGRLP